ncbi:MAG TPA: imidazolonepropionase, partial [Pirellulaceae bacterium]
MKVTAGNLILRNCRVATMAGPPPDFEGVRPAFVAVREGSIVHVGKELAPEHWAPGSIVVDGGDRLLTPGLIDCHTHIVYGGHRANEFRDRIAGASYESIARQGGGILSTVRSTRAADEEHLFESARRRLVTLIADGLTTVEIKSGYGLNLETELKMLRVARRLGESLPLDVRTTLLAAHAIPPEFADRPEEYVDQVCQDMIPACVGQADAVDVFCEAIAFSVDQSRRILESARQHGFATKIHAEQRTLLGGAAMAAGLGALSADHLEYLDEEGVQVLAQSGTIATLLPGAYYFLRETRCPPVDALRRHGVPIAIASDTNPGSSPLGSLQLVLNMACVLFGLTPSEALAGMTRHAAAAL